MTPPRLLRLTPKGRTAFWENQIRRSPSLPADYLRIMGLVEFQAHSEVIRAYLRRFPDRLIDEWLAEMEELGFIESAESAPDGEVAFAGHHPRPMPPLLEEDKALLADQSAAAAAVLGRAGVYIAEERIRNRAASAKRPAETEILIVEDDPDQRALAELRVAMAGYRVRTADGAGALARALQRGAPPDLLLLDVMLPDGDGFDILADVRRSPRLASLPVVMLTVKNDPADVEKGLALGADGYIAKPYSKAVIAEVIRYVLGETKR